MALTPRKIVGGRRLPIRCLTRAATVVVFASLMGCATPSLAPLLPKVPANLTEPCVPPTAPPPAMNNGQLAAAYLEALAAYADCAARQKALSDAVRSNYTTEPVKFHRGRAYPTVTAAQQVERDRQRLHILYLEQDAGLPVAREIERAKQGRM